ncbi:MAG TPA: DMT family transporter [Beijerinckiaceae bacterium]|mgnify:CR=1 FL=1|nr:DMT family transporter [Beijerinckiaceae bacterium]
MRAKPILLALAAIGLFAVMNVLIKHLSFYYDTLQVAFVRYLSAGLVALLWVWRMRPGWPAIDVVEGNVLRGVLSLATGLSFFYALALLPLADAIALSFLAPVFMMIFSSLFLKERPGLLGLLAIAFGFAGMLVMLWGKLESDGRSLWGVSASVFSAVTYALSMILLRSRAQRDPVALIVFFQSWIPALLIAPMAGTAWEPLAYQDIAPFAALGVLGVTAHLLMATAYSRASAATLAPIEYSALIWAALLGFFIFAEMPTWRTLAGAALIVAGSLLTSRR